MERSPGSSRSRFGTSVALLLLGFSIVVAVSTAPPGPRLSRRERLVDLIAREDERSRALRRELEELQAQIEALKDNAEVRERSLGGLRTEIDRLATVAGMTEVDGPAVVVELRDSTMRQSPTGDPNDLVIHEQDLQAVVNALWAAGAEAMAINGERITSSSAVRCVGNTLLLHGSVYAPPYQIAAIGEPQRLLDGLASDALVQRFQIFAEEYRLGFRTRVEPSLALPPFRGLVAVNHARRAAP